MSSMDKYWQLEKNSKSERIYKNLERQIEKVFKHSRQGSIKTRVRYEDGVKHLAKFLAVNFNKKSLNNIRNDHIEAYVEQMQETGYSASYVTTNMSSIRFFVDQIKDSSYIKSNEELGVIPRGKEERIGPSRAWTSDEIKDMQELAVQNGFGRVADMIKLSYLQGLRIHEVTRLERADLQRALRNNFLTVKGKGGLVRDVPLRNQDSKDLLNKLIKQTDLRNYKVFVNPGEKTHQVIKQVQNFIANNRDLICPEKASNRSNLTFHGTRHTYCCERFQELLKVHSRVYDAKLELSKELGHFRVAITEIYLKEYEGDDQND